MFINKLSFQNLRGLELIALDPSKSLNFIVGPNNAGKTTILESIYLLSCSKTFRGTNLDKMIQNGKNFFKIVAKISEKTSNVSICLQKNLKLPKISTINDDKVSTKECLSNLPVFSLCFGVENLFNTSADNRRSLIDSGLFHVKHEYLSKLQNYNKILNARNKSLKNKNDLNLSYLTDKLIDNGMLINEYRTRYMDELSLHLKETLTELSNNSALYSDISNASFYYKSGYSNEPLKSQYDDCLHKDLALGYTTIGPHRADLDFKISDDAVKDIASMSTQIILSLCFVIAQTRAFHVKHGHYPVLLIDDIFFGIDDKNLAVMIKLLSNSGAQCFLSAPDLYNEKVKEIIGSSHNKLFTLVDMK